MNVPPEDANYSAFAASVGVDRGNSASSSARRVANKAEVKPQSVLNYA